MSNESHTSITYPSDEHGGYSFPDRMIAPRFRQIEAQETDSTAAILRARAVARQIDCFDRGSPRPLEIPLHSVDSAAVVWALLADPEGMLPVTDKAGGVWFIHYAGDGLYARGGDTVLALRDLVAAHAPLTAGPEPFTGMTLSFAASYDFVTRSAAIQSALLRRGISATVYPSDEDDGSIGICEPQAGGITLEWSSTVTAAIAEFVPPLRAELTEDGNALTIYEKR